MGFTVGQNQATVTPVFIPFASKRYDFCRFSICMGPSLRRGIVIKHYPNYEKKNMKNRWDSLPRVSTNC
jgi:hypothetical protein